MASSTITHQDLVVKTLHESQGDNPIFTTARFGREILGPQTQFKYFQNQNTNANEAVNKSHRITLNPNLRQQPRSLANSRRNSRIRETGDENNNGQRVFSEERKSKQPTLINSDFFKDLALEGQNEIRGNIKNKENYLSSAASSTRPRLASQNQGDFQCQPSSKSSSRQSSNYYIVNDRQVPLQNMPTSVTLHQSLLKSPPSSSQSSQKMITCLDQSSSQSTFGEIYFGSSATSSSRRSGANIPPRNYHVTAQSLGVQYLAAKRMPEDFFKGNKTSNGPRIIQAKNANERMKRQLLELQSQTDQLTNQHTTLETQSNSFNESMNLSLLLGQNFQHSSQQQNRIYVQTRTTNTTVTTPTTTNNSRRLSRHPHIHSMNQSMITDQPTQQLSQDLDSSQSQSKYNRHQKLIRRNLESREHMRTEKQSGKNGEVMIERQRDVSIGKKESVERSLGDFSQLSLANKVAYVRSNKSQAITSVQSETQFMQLPQCFSPIRENNSLPQIPCKISGKSQSMRQSQLDHQPPLAPLSPDQEPYNLSKDQTTGYDYLQPSILLSPNHLAQTSFSPQHLSSNTINDNNHLSHQALLQTKKHHHHHHHQRLTTLNDHYKQGTLESVLLLQSPTQSKENKVERRQESVVESSQKRSSTQGIKEEMLTVNNKGQRKYRGMAQRVVLPKKSSFLSISGMTQIIDSGSKENRVFGVVPFRDVTDNHKSNLNQENQIYQQKEKSQGPNFNVSFGNFPKFHLNFNNIAMDQGAQSFNSPIGIQTGLSLISSHKKNEIAVDENHFNSPTDKHLLPFGNQDALIYSSPLAFPSFLELSSTSHIHCPDPQSLSFLLTSPLPPLPEHIDPPLFSTNQPPPPPHTHDSLLSPTKPTINDNLVSSQTFDDARKLLKTPCFLTNSAVKYKENSGSCQQQVKKHMRQSGQESILKRSEVIKVQKMMI